MDKKLKISIIGSRGYPYVYSGYETLVKELSERLVKKGHSVRVYCHRSLFKKKPKYVNGIELVYTPSIETKFLSQITNSFFSFIHICLNRSDLVLVLNTANGPFGLLTKIFKIKTCINVDGLEWLRPKWRGLGSIYFKISSKFATFFFDQIITDSAEMSKIYKLKYKKDSTVIAYGSTMTDTNESFLLNEYGLSKNEYYLIVGRLIPDNNSKFICQEFLKSNSKKKIVIVGDVPYNDSYANNIKLMANDRVVITGYIKSQEHLTQLYKNCYCYIHGHEFGGTNPTMVNALDLNCNIIALNTIFNKEMLINKKAIFFEKKINSFRDSILKFENEINFFNSQNLKYRLPNNYDWDHITKQYYTLFCKITSFRNK